MQVRTRILLRSRGNFPGLLLLLETMSTIPFGFLYGAYKRGDKRVLAKKHFGLSQDEAAKSSLFLMRSLHGVVLDHQQQNPLKKEYALCWISKGEDQATETMHKLLESFELGTFTVHTTSLTTSACTRQQYIPLVQAFELLPEEVIPVPLLSVLDVGQTYCNSDHTRNF